jgi:hypothetical protein
VIWPYARVADGLLRLAHDHGGEHFPPHRVIRAYSRTLLRSMQETGGSRTWARRAWARALAARPPLAFLRTHALIGARKVPARAPRSYISMHGCGPPASPFTGRHDENTGTAGGESGLRSRTRRRWRLLIASPDLVVIRVVVDHVEARAGEVEPVIAFRLRPFAAHGRQRLQ